MAHSGRRSSMPAVSVTIERISPRPRRTSLMLPKLAARLAIALSVGVAAPSAAAKDAEPAAMFVGSQACSSCHIKQYDAWRGSQHQAAMQEASEKTVLANFGDTRFTYAGVASAFSKRDGKFF